MGGFGSGRTGWSTKAEHCRFIEVNRLHREGCLDMGYRNGWAWWRDSGEKVASIGMKSDGAVLTLDYRISGRDGQEDVTQGIHIERVPCHHGGTRPYFRCPGVVNGRVCGRRVGKLFLSGRYFLCRHCHRIAYTSQSETRLDRLYRKRDKRRVSLGGNPGIGAWPRKPKGMWWRTYERHLAELRETELESSLAFNDMALRFLKRR